MQLHRNLMVEYEQIDCGAYPQEVYEDRIHTIKTFFLKRDYFKKHPNSKEKYTGDFSIPNYFNITTCDIHGGFEASYENILN